MKKLFYVFVIVSLVLVCFSADAQTIRGTNGENIGRVDSDWNYS